MIDAAEQATPDAAEVLPRLRRLDVQGFKSFATRTSFVFEAGITAIVGPNGSGKSNVADAVRWVLGEQGSSALRAKKNEDIIFAGGQGRAPGGLAEATLTFDNRDEWLPLPYPEVAVTRRAYRGGETQYLINGKRVRLKDVALVTAGLGQSHVVVGQGLVDSALSARPEERRALFEHAADLTGLRLKVAEARRNLAEAEANSSRVRDLLAEVEPRVIALERAARQSREARSLREELTTLLTAHLGGMYQAARDEHDRATVTEKLAEERRVLAGAALAQAESRLAAALEQAEAARNAVTAHEQHHRNREDVLRSLRHERDLAAERSAALTRRRQDMTSTRTGLDEQAATVRQEQERLARDMKTLDDQRLAAAARVAEANRAVHDARQARSDHEQTLQLLTARVTTLARQDALLEQRIALARQRQTAGSADRERLLEEHAERQARILTLSAEIAATREQADALREQLAELDQRITTLGAREQDAARSMESISVRLAALQRERDAAVTRLEVLRRMQESGAGFFAGVKTVLTASRDGTLGGILGAVSELIAVPADLETAVEVALGGRLQDIVVERWRDAEAAIGLLKRTNAGRATFQPLDVVDSRLPEPPVRALRTPGVRGVAAKLVDCTPAARPVIDALLGRTLIVADLPVTREIMPMLPGGWSVVTPGGEIARSGGSVTGGARVRESGVLARERELRELPDAIRSLEFALAAQHNQHQTATLEARAVAAEQTANRTRHAALTAAAAEATRQEQRARDWLTGLEREHERTAARIASLGAAREQTEAELKQAEAEQTRDEAELAAVRAEHDARLTERAALDHRLAEATRTVSSAGEQRAALDERVQAEQRRATALAARIDAIAAELAMRDEREAALNRERERLEADHPRLEQSLAALEAECATLALAHPPLLAVAREAGQAVSRETRAREQGGEARLAAERAHDVALLAAQRAADAVDAVVRRLHDELDLDDPSGLASAPVARGSADEIARRERDIGRLRDRLRRVGYAGEDVEADHAREAERGAFLRVQLDDIAGASESLRALLAELDQTMESRFKETFGRVAAEFSQIFQELFGGGSANLELARDDDGEPAVEIVACPPGKRTRRLALLSGGERALTAVALLFAILRVNPAPFCLLDEVDAALDEANVVRFREQLQRLAGQTQTVVITHNRGTIEIADALYGVTMGADGVSTVLSMRLSAPAPNNESAGGLRK